MPAPINCCACPDAEVIVEVPGTQGDDGADGADGQGAFTLTDGVAGPFDKGDAGITITVLDESPYVVGMNVAIEDAKAGGALPGYFTVTAVAANQLTLTYQNIAANADASSIATGKLVTVVGPPYTPGTLPTAITDASGATASNGIALGIGITQLFFPHTFIGGTAAVEPVTNLVLGYAFKILSWTFVTEVLLAGAAGSRVANMEIGTTDVGTVVSTCTIPIANAAVGTLTAGTAVSGAQTGTAASTFSIEIANGGTLFSAGSGTFVVTIQNLDTADAIASLSDHVNDLIVALT